MNITQLPREGDGPFASREEAAARYAGFSRGALSGVGGTGELVYEPGQLELDTMVDTLFVTGVEVGDYDLEVLARVAGLLDPTDCAVLDALFKRAANDTPDPDAYVVTGRKPRHLHLAPG